MNYITQADEEAYLGVNLTPNGVALFGLAQPLMQALIDKYCNRSWGVTNPQVEDFDALSVGGKFFLANYTFFPKFHISPTPADPAYPLCQGIISAVIGTSSLDKNYIVSYGTHLKFSASFPSVILANPLGFKMVHITYNTDDTGLPGPIKLAFCQWMGRLIQESPDAGKEVTRVQSGTVLADYVGDKLGGMPNFVKLVLDMYRLPPLDHF